LNKLDLKLLFSDVVSEGNDDAHEGVNWYLWTGAMVFLGRIFALISELVLDYSESG
jgi:hypothetical protein